MGGRGKKKDGWSSVGILAHPPPPGRREKPWQGGAARHRAEKPPRPRAGGHPVGAFGGLPPRSFYVTCVPWVLSTCGWEFWVPLGRLVAVSVGAGTIVMNFESLRV